MGKGNEKKIQAPYVWPIAIDPWQLSGPGGQGGGGGGGWQEAKGAGRGGGGHVPELRRYPPVIFQGKHKGPVPRSKTRNDEGI